MQKKICLFLLSFFASTLVLADYQVGLSMKDISPTAGREACMGGYDFLPNTRRCGAREVVGDLRVSSLYIADNDTDVIIMSIDTIGIGDRLMADIKAAVSVELAETLDDGTLRNFPLENIHVAATHTHSGPDLQGLWGGMSSAYRSFLIEEAGNSAMDAKENSQPVSLYASRSIAEVKNRRGLYFAFDEVTTLSFRNSNNELSGLLVNMSAHPTILDGTNIRFSSDYVDSLRSTLEAETGAPVIFINGIIGDAEPASQSEGRTFAIAEAYGRDVAAGIVQELPKAEIIHGNLNVKTKSFVEKVENKDILAAMVFGLDINVDWFSNVHTTVTLFDFGGKVKAISVPGEVLTSVGDQILNSIAGGGNTYKMVFGLMDASYGYFLESGEYGSIPGRDTEERSSINKFAGDDLFCAVNAWLKSSSEAEPADQCFFWISCPVLSR